LLANKLLCVKDLAAPVPADRGSILALGGRIGYVLGGKETREPLCWGRLVGRAGVELWLFRFVPKKHIVDVCMCIGSYLKWSEELWCLIQLFVNCNEVWCEERQPTVFESIIS
jgi:hypothetical protein